MTVVKLLSRVHTRDACIPSVNPALQMQSTYCQSQHLFQHVTFHLDPLGCSVSVVVRALDL